MTTLARVCMVLYRALLRLYPAQFRALFAEEMQSIAALVLQDAMRQGWFAFLRVCLRECTALLVGALREHFAERYVPAARKIARARWLARGLALLYVVFWTSLLLLNEDVRSTQAALVACVVGLVAVDLLLGQRLGGWLVLLAGVALVGATVRGAGLYSLDPLAFLIGLPFVIAGAILVACGSVRTPPSGSAGENLVAVSALQRQQTLFVQLRSALLALAGTISLLATWYLLAIALLAMTEIALVPWDTVGEPIRPAHGAWQRALNDFFESGVGAFLPATMALFSSLSALLACLREPARRMLGLWLCTGANVIYIALLFVALIGMNAYRDWFGIHDPGYHATWPGILAIAVGTLLYALLPVRMLLTKTFQT